MPGQSDFPEKWSCQSPNKKVRVEILVYETEQRVIEGRVEDVPTDEATWIEIPTESVEQYVAKGEAAQLQRSTKVVFPEQWGSASGNRTNAPSQLVTQFTEGGDEPFTWARISYRDQRRDDADWVVTQIGWVGGLGPAADPGTAKMWVYDPAELLSGTAVQTRFQFPTVQQAAEQAAKLVNDNTPIPIRGVEVVPPETEAEFETVASKVTDGQLSGGRNFSGNLVYMYPQVTGDPQSEPVGPVDEGENFEAAIIDTRERDVQSLLSDFDLRTSKTFTTNRDTLQDVFDWIERKTGAKMHFEPTSEGFGVRLVLDVEPERRRFSQKAVVEDERDEGDGDYSFLQTVSVLKNNALYEMKPINTLRMDGAKGAGFLDASANWLSDVEDLGDVITEKGPSTKYPYAKVQVPELVEAAEGVELGPRKESEAATESDLIEEAKQEMREILSETSEGEIFIKGVPRILPFDSIDSYEVCNDHIIYEQESVRYEVEEVKHTATANDIYKTRLLVSIWANEKNIVVVASGMADADNTE